MGLSSASNILAVTTAVDLSSATRADGSTDSSIFATLGPLKKTA